MPIYEYACPGCGIIEHWQKASDAPLEKCPKCSAPVKKLIGRNISIIYKAGGFHTTDYRDRAYTEAKKKDEEGGSGSAPSKAADGGTRIGD